MFDSKHLPEVCMNYSEHLFLSLHLSLMFFTGGVCAAIHAVYPDVFPSSSTDISNRIVQKIKKSGCTKKLKIDIPEDDDEPLYNPNHTPTPNPTPNPTPRRG